MGGFLFGKCSKCCDCDCDCESPFGIFVNGITIQSGEVLDPPSYQFIPNLGIPLGAPFFPDLSIANNAAWLNEDLANRCDEDGNLIVRVTIGMEVRFQDTSEFPASQQAVVAATQDYKFDLSGGACRLLTGEPVGQGTFELLTTAPEDGYDPADFVIDWSQLTVQAWCKKGCDSNLVVGDITFLSPDSFTPNSDCKDFLACDGGIFEGFPTSQCECYQPLDGYGQPLEQCFFTGGTVPGSPGIPQVQCNEIFSCRLRNPLP
jgi:hypothetical protein